MLLQTVLEGLGLGILLIIICAVGIRKGAVGMVHLYSPEVQERCITLGLTTHAKIKRIKSLYWSKGGTLKKILWCDDDSIKPYFIAAGENLTYTNLRRQILDSLEDKPFPYLAKELQKHMYFEFGRIEDHFKYRQAVMEAYPCGNYPVFEGYDHMQYQIRDPKGFAEMLTHIIEHDGMPKLPVVRK